MIYSLYNKNYSLQFTYMLLSQYEFLYSTLVIKLLSHSDVLGVHAVVCHGCGV